jgi:alpha-amylase
MPPIRFVFGLHLHQPVGNFDHVFRQHLDDVYAPLVERLEAGSFFPVVLHVSGPLLEWLDTNAPAYLDRLGAHAREGRIEFLLAGFHEPILATLPRRDRVEQVQWLRDFIERRFGVPAESAWLTERVWEQDLAADLADAGVRAVVVDDRHFLVSGFARDALHSWYQTEHDGRRLGVFPIDERLRYLVPFRPPAETAAYLRALQRAGHPLAVLADDGEKFGGWPGTKEWVYGKGWLDAFTREIAALVDEGVVRLSTLREALDEVPCAGLAYLPTASYREMEGWALPAEPQAVLHEVEQALGDEGLRGPKGALLRGGHWRHFLVKYPESNRLHKMMLALSALCRRRGDPPAVRRAVARAQCNDAYWHGVFGGLYLPHLRSALWAELAEAERLLRAGEPLAWEVADIDADGHDELWLHSAGWSLLVAPARGGAIEVWQRLADRTNLADTLTRRREAYHLQATEAAAQEAAGPADGTPSIHDIEHGLRLDALPPVDPHDRAILVERLHPAGNVTGLLERGEAPTARSWAREPMSLRVEREEDGIFVRLAARDGSLVKELRVHDDGTVDVAFRWARGLVDGGWFSTEISLAAPVAIVSEPAAQTVVYPIETVAKSEKGLDRTRQGESFTLLWNADLGTASLRLNPAAPAAE